MWFYMTVTNIIKKLNIKMAIYYGGVLFGGNASVVDL